MEIVSKRGEPHDLQAIANRLFDRVTKTDWQEMRGDVRGLGFRVCHSMLKKHDPHLTGLHVLFGHRVILHINKVNDTNLPNLFYAEVYLDPAWKDCLSDTKVAITKYRDEFFQYLAEILAPWIKDVEDYERDDRMEQLDGLLGKAIEEALVCDPDAAGGGRRLGRDVESSVEHDKSGKVVKFTPRPREESEPGGPDGASRRRVRAPLKIQPVRSDTLGNLAARVSHDGIILKVELNILFLPIAIAHKRPYKIAAIWPVVAHAIAQYGRDNPIEWQRIMPDSEDRLCSRDDGALFENLLFSYVLKKQPDITESDIKASA